MIVSFLGSLLSVLARVLPFLAATRSTESTVHAAAFARTWRNAMCRYGRARYGGDPTDADVSTAARILREHGRPAAYRLLEWCVGPGWYFAEMRSLEEFELAFHRMDERRRGELA